MYVYVYIRKNFYKIKPMDSPTTSWIRTPTTTNTSIKIYDIYLLNFGLKKYKH